MLLMSCFIQSNKLQTVFLLSLQIAAELNAIRITAILFKIGYWWLREGSHRAEPADSTTQRAVTPSHADVRADTGTRAHTSAGARSVPAAPEAAPAPQHPRGCGPCSGRAGPEHRRELAAASRGSAAKPPGSLLLSHPAGGAESSHLHKQGKNNF